MDDEDAIPLDENDFRRERRYLAPWMFAWPGDDEGTTWPPPTDLVTKKAWDDLTVLPTDVLLKSTSYEGSLVARLHTLQSDWIFSWPDVGEDAFMEMPSVLAGEEFDALVHNAVHGWYRQALGCLRNALETMTAAAACAVTGNQSLYEGWQAGDREIRFSSARAMLRDSAAGQAVDAAVHPESVFGNDHSAWMKARYHRLCSYAHSEAGYNNTESWESNGPVFNPKALETVEAEFRETLALCYLLLRVGWSGYQTGPGEPALLANVGGDWTKYEPLLRTWLL